MIKYLHYEIFCIFVYLVTTELKINSLGKMNDDKKNTNKVLLPELIEKGMKSFMAHLKIPDQVYGILSVSVKDMHLALNRHDDTSQFNN